MKKKIIGLVLIGLLFVGCAKITYKDGKLSYWRLGKQDFKGFVMSKKTDGTLEVKFDEQKGGPGELSKALLNLTEIAKSVTIP